MEQDIGCYAKLKVSPLSMLYLAAPISFNLKYYFFYFFSPIAYSIVVSSPMCFEITKRNTKVTATKDFIVYFFAPAAMPLRIPVIPMYCLLCIVFGHQAVAPVVTDILIRAWGFIWTSKYHDNQNTWTLVSFWLLHCWICYYCLHVYFPLYPYEHDKDVDSCWWHGSYLLFCIILLMPFHLSKKERKKKPKFITCKWIKLIKKKKNVQYANTVSSLLFLIQSCWLNHDSWSSVLINGSGSITPFQRKM